MNSMISPKRFQQALDDSMQSIDSHSQLSREKMLIALQVERHQAIDTLIALYLKKVQGWDIDTLKKCLTSMKNLKIKGAESLQRISRQGCDEEQWYFKDQCILITRKYTLEIISIGNWYYGGDYEPVPLGFNTKYLKEEIDYV